MAAFFSVSPLLHGIIQRVPRHAIRTHCESTKPARTAMHVRKDVRRRSLRTVHVRARKTALWSRCRQRKRPETGEKGEGEGEIKRKKTRKNEKERKGRAGTKRECRSCIYFFRLFLRDGTSRATHISRLASFPGFSFLLLPPCSFFSWQTWIYWNVTVTDNWELLEVSERFCHRLEKLNETRRRIWSLSRGKSIGAGVKMRVKQSTDNTKGRDRDY